MRLIDADKLMLSLNDNYLATSPTGNETLAVQDYRESMCEGLEIAMATVEGAPTIGGWISVKDRLPEKPGRYLCWFGKNTFAVGASIVPYIPDLHWFASLESLERYENVTHWMPMPAPPEVSHDDD